MRALSRVWPLAVVGALASSAGLMACGQSRSAQTTVRAAAVAQPARSIDPHAVVAKVGPYWITAATLERSTRASLGDQPASERLVPPNFGACVARLESESAARGERKLESAQLRSECQRRYETLRQQALASLITDYWLIGAARELRLPIDSHSADANIALEAKLASAAIKRAVTQRVRPVSRAQIVSYYQQHRFRYLTSASRDVRIARTKTSVSATAVKAKLASGESFASVVRRLPVQQADYSNEGLVLGLGPHIYGEPRLNEAIFTTAPGALTGPIRTWFGYFVFEVTKVRSEHVKPLAAVQASIRQQLMAPLRKTALNAFFKRWRATWSARTTCTTTTIAPDCRRLAGSPAPPASRTP